MSRGSKIAIGSMCALCALVFGMMAPAHGPTTPIGTLGFVGLSAFFAIAAAGCFMRRNNQIPMRITAGGVSLVIVITTIGILLDGDIRPGMFGMILIAIGTGYYAATGTYPVEMPYSEVFGNDDETSGRRKRRKKRPETAKPGQSRKRTRERRTDSDSISPRRRRP